MLTGGKTVALTFDDGPDPASTPQTAQAARPSRSVQGDVLPGRQQRRSSTPSWSRQIVAGGHTPLQPHLEPQPEARQDSPAPRSAPTCSGPTRRSARPRPEARRSSTSGRPAATSRPAWSRSPGAGHDLDLLEGRPPRLGPPDGRDRDAQHQPRVISSGGEAAPARARSCSPTTTPSRTPSRPTARCCPGCRSASSWSPLPDQARRPAAGRVQCEGGMTRRWPRRPVWWPGRLSCSLGARRRGRAGGLADGVGQGHQVVRGGRRAARSRRRGGPAPSRAGR